MAAIVALLGQVLGILSSVFGIVSNVLGIVGTAAQETAKYQIQKIAAAAANTVNSPTFGNAALLAAIADVKAQTIANTAALSLQIIDLTDGTTPVSLPVVPPSGYSAPSESDVAHAVWYFLMPSRGYEVFNYLYAAGNWGAFSANLRWLGDEVRYFEAVYGSADYVPGAADWVPVFDPTDILVTEDILACLTRQNPGWTVGWAFAPDGYVRLNFPGTAEIQEWQSTFDQSDFLTIKSRIFPVTTVTNAPIWPGLSNVVLGTPVAITSSMTITAPMHGVLVNISSVTVNKPSVAYGTELAFKFIGALAFVNDDGEVEQFQPLGFTDALYCCLAMTEAASVVVRADPSVVGTVTPWVIA